MSQYEVLAFIEKHKDRQIFATEIAEALNMRIRGVHQKLNALAKSKFIVLEYVRCTGLGLKSSRQVQFKKRVQYIDEEKK